MPDPTDNTAGARPGAEQPNAPGAMSPRAPLPSGASGAGEATPGPDAPAGGGGRPPAGALDTLAAAPTDLLAEVAGLVGGSRLLALNVVVGIHDWLVSRGYRDASTGERPECPERPEQPYSPDDWTPDNCAEWLSYADQLEDLLRGTGERDASPPEPGVDRVIDRLMAAATRVLGGTGRDGDAELRRRFREALPMDPPASPPEPPESVDWGEPGRGSLQFTRDGAVVVALDGDETVKLPWARKLTLPEAHRGEVARMWSEHAASPPDRQGEGERLMLGRPPEGHAERHWRQLADDADHGELTAVGWTVATFVPLPELERYRGEATIRADRAVDKNIEVATWRDRLDAAEVELREAVTRAEKAERDVERMLRDGQEWLRHVVAPAGLRGHGQHVTAAIGDDRWRCDHCGGEWSEPMPTQRFGECWRAQLGRRASLLDALRNPSDELIRAYVRSAFDTHAERPNTLQRSQATKDLAAIADALVEHGHAQGSGHADAQVVWTTPAVAELLRAQGDDGRQRYTFTIKLGEDEADLLGRLCEVPALTPAEHSDRCGVPLRNTNIALSNLRAIGAAERKGNGTWTATDEGRALWQRAAEREEGDRASD